MEKARRKVRITNFYLPLLLSYILSDEICETYIFTVFSAQSLIPIIALFLPMVVLQIFASPIQAGFSDFYCRKRSLVISLFSSSTSLILISLYFFGLIPPLIAFIFIILTKGGLGNTLPLSWAGIADTQNRNFRFSLGLSTAAIAFGFFIADFLFEFVGTRNSSLMLIAVYLILSILNLKYFNDIRDKDLQKKEPFEGSNKWTGFVKEISLVWKDIKLIGNEFKLKEIRNALTSFLLWQISFYSVFILDADLHNTNFTGVTAAMTSGYLIGVGILKFCQNFTDHQMIKLGYKTCIK